jgi:hypothetical protein
MRPWQPARDRPTTARSPRSAPGRQHRRA